MILSYQDIIKVRNAIENTYDCLCDIIEYQSTKNATNKRTEYEEIIVLKKQPCRISYKTISNANETENENSVVQVVKLFISPYILIKPRF